MLTIGDTVIVNDSDFVLPELIGQTGQIIGRFDDLFVVKFTIPVKSVNGDDLIETARIDELDLTKVDSIGESYSLGDTVVVRMDSNVDPKFLGREGTIANIFAGRYQVKFTDGEGEEAFETEYFDEFDLDVIEELAEVSNNKMKNDIESNAKKYKNYKVEINESIPYVSVETKSGDSIFYAQGDSAEELIQDAEAAVKKFDVLLEDYILYSLVHNSNVLSESVLESSAGTVRSDIKAIAKMYENLKITINNALPYVAVDENEDCVYYVQGSEAIDILRMASDASVKFNVSESEYVIYHLNNAGVLGERKVSGLHLDIAKVSESYKNAGYTVSDKLNGLVVEDATGTIIARYNLVESGRLKEAYRAYNFPASITLQDYVMYVLESQEVLGESLKESAQVAAPVKFIEKSLLEFNNRIGWYPTTFENSLKYGAHNKKYNFKLKKVNYLHELKGGALALWGGQMQRKINEQYEHLVNTKQLYFPSMFGREFSLDYRLQKLAQTRSLTEGNLRDLGYVEIADRLGEELMKQSIHNPVSFDTFVEYDSVSEKLNVESKVVLPDGTVYSVLQHSTVVDHSSEAANELKKCLATIIEKMFG